MRGDLLALGAMGVLAIAGASKRGARAEGSAIDQLSARLKRRLVKSGHVVYAGVWIDETCISLGFSATRKAAQKCPVPEQRGGFLLRAARDIVVSMGFRIEEGDRTPDFFVAQAGNAKLLVHLQSQNEIDVQIQDTNPLSLLSGATTNPWEEIKNLKLVEPWRVRAGAKNAPEPTRPTRRKIDMRAIQQAKEAIELAWKDILVATGEMTSEDSLGDVEFDPTDYFPLHLERGLKKHSKLNVLGIGGARAVFDLGDGTVLKLPLASVYDEVSQSEIENWKKSRKDDRVHELYLPLLKHGTIEGAPYAIFPKAKPLLRRDVPNWLISDIQELYEEGAPGLNSLDFGDGNFGEYKGKIVLIDYASEL